MFSPIGKQKLLQQIKLAEDRGVADPLQHVLNAHGYAGSRPGSSHAGSRPGSSHADSRPASSSSRRRSRSVDGPTPVESAGQVISTSKLEKLLADPGVDGVVMNRVLESTVRYRPDKDAIVLKAFQSKHIEYAYFRHFLREAFLLTFTNDEYDHLTAIFDTSNAGVIDGYSFMIAFIRLGGIRKDLFAASKRQESEEYLQRVHVEECKRKEEQESKYLVPADFDYDASTKAAALSKLFHAAKGYDPGHPSAPSLEAFEASHMSVALLRETCRSAFNLRVSIKEITAILQHFDGKDKGASGTGKGNLLRLADESVVNNATETLTRQLDVNCKGFLRHFFRVGIDERDKEKAEQRSKQAALDKLARDEHQRKLQEAENKMSMSVDYEFSSSDEASCLEKLKEASTKYDRNAPGCQSLDGFECQSLSAGAFKDLIRRIFNLTLTNRELGYIINKYDVHGKGELVCNPFITAFLKVGREEREKRHIAQLEKQARLIQEAEREHMEKMKAVVEGRPVEISSAFTDADITSAKHKLVEASVYFDSSKPGALISFEPQYLSPLDFIRAIKRTFNLALTTQELGYVVSLYDKDGSGNIHCKTFLNGLFAMGHEERDRHRLEQLERNREGERLMKEREEKKKYDLLNKTDIEVDYVFTDGDRNSALAKLLVASTKFDRAHPAAMSLEGFDCFSLKAPAFKEIVRRTFNLKLSPKEVGALVRHFDKSEEGSGTDIECGDFLNVFLQMGYAERAKMHRAQLERQRAEDKARLEKDAAALLATTQRGGGNLEVDMQYEEKDMFSAVEKLVAAAEKYDKFHPAAPDISAFDIATMTPGLFKENVKRCFNLKFEPKELGFCISTYGNADLMINSCDFMTKFVMMGKASLHEKHRKFLEKKRADAAAAKKDAEDKLLAQFEKAENAVLIGLFDEGDCKSALEKMAVAAFRFDKNHPSAPSTAVFTGGLMKPGQFRECAKNTFQLRLTPREAAAFVHAFPWYEGDKKTGDIDTKAFMVKFVRLGFEKRSEAKLIELEKQRAAEKEMIEKAEKALIDAGIGKADTDVDFNYTEADNVSVYQKMTASSAKYDKNAPGCVSPEAFDAAFLTPYDFREVMKRVFAITLTNKEIAVLLDDFSDGAGNLFCKPFMIAFTKLGAEERYKFSMAQLERQRHATYMRKTAHERNVKEAEEKMVVKVSFDFTPEQRESAFQKLTLYAKKYDKQAPGCMSLESFEAKTLNLVQFRESLKRTFGLILSPPELGAIITFFDKNKTGHIVSREFIIYFLQVGQAERDKDHTASLLFQRKEIEDRKKAEEEMLRAMWAKTELKVAKTFTEREKEVAMEKLAEAAFKFDPATPGPMGLTAFQAQYLTPAVFREMLKRSFNLRVSDAELAALVDEYECSSLEKHIDCQLFMVKFTQMGFEWRNEVRLAQLEKNRLGLKEIKEHHEIKVKETADKMAEKADYAFSNADFNSALEKVRKFAANYDRGHPAAPSLSGFQGANMLPFEFKDMVMRCFHVAFTDKELGALVKYFDTSETLTIDSQAFLAHFYKICRQEQEKRRKMHIDKIFTKRKAAREQEAELERKKEIEESQKIVFVAADEVTFLTKLRKAAKLYAFDSAALQEPLQAFKGPALTPLAFRDIFSRVFTSIKFTFPEVGVLLNILDTAGVGSLDGPRFLNWFYKLGRIEGRIMLGEAEDDVTLEGLRAAAKPQGVITTASNIASTADGGETSFRVRSSSRAQTAPGRTRSQSSMRSSASASASGSPFTTSETVASIVASITTEGRQNGLKEDNKTRSMSSFLAPRKKAESNIERTMSSSAMPMHFPDRNNDNVPRDSDFEFLQDGAFLNAIEVFAPKAPFRPQTTPAAQKRTKSGRSTSKEPKLQEIEVLHKRPSGAMLHEVPNPAIRAKPATRKFSKSRAVNSETKVSLPDIASPIATIKKTMTTEFLSTEVWTTTELLTAATTLTILPEDDYNAPVGASPEVPPSPPTVRPSSSPSSSPPTVRPSSFSPAPEVEPASITTSPIKRESKSSSSLQPVPPISTASPGPPRKKLLVVKDHAVKPKPTDSHNMCFFPNLLNGGSI